MSSSQHAYVLHSAEDFLHKRHVFRSKSRWYEISVIFIKYCYCYFKLYISSCKRVGSDDGRNLKFEDAVAYSAVTLILNFMRSRQLIRKLLRRKRSIHYHEKSVGLYSFRSENQAQNVINCNQWSNSGNQID